MLLHDISLLSSFPSVFLNYLAGQGTQTSTFTVPAEAKAGDFILYFNVSLGSAVVPAEVIPSGFTKISGLVYAFSRSVLAGKILTKSDEGATFSIMNGNGGYNVAQILYFRPTRPLVNFNSTGTIENSINAPANQTVTTTSLASVPALVFAFYQSDGTITTRTFSGPLSPDGEVSMNTGPDYAKYLILDDRTSSNFTIGMGDYGNNYLASGLITFS